MRPFLVPIFLLAATPVLGQTPEWLPGRSEASHPAINLNAGAHFGRRAGGDSDVLFRGPLAAPPMSERNVLPIVTLGPFQASLGGQVQEGGGNAGLGGAWGSHFRHGGGTHAQLEIDTESFWGSHVSGSIDTRGARITFALPMP